MLNFGDACTYNMTVMASFGQLWPVLASYEQLLTVSVFVAYPGSRIQYPVSSIQMMGTDCIPVVVFSDFHVPPSLAVKKGKILLIFARNMVKPTKIHLSVLWFETQQCLICLFGCEQRLIVIVGCIQ